LNELAAKNRILLSSLVKNLYTGSIIQSYSGEGLFKVLTPADEALLTRLMDVTESRLNDQQLSVSSLSREVGLSRPQLYRKMVDLTENSPGDFIRKLRLNKAEKLMRRQDQNIAEIALTVGFSNPSYFSKCFFDRFGALPSQYLETA
jgi:AraC-like DNA-binding protein